MAIKITKEDNFVWKIVNEEQAEKLFDIFELYELHEGGESLIQSYEDLLDLLKSGAEIGIEVGFINEKITITKYARRNNATGKGMNEGYCFHDGEYYCETEKEAVEFIRANCEDGGKGLTDEYLLEESYKLEEHYWTQWEEIGEEDDYFDEDGNEYDSSGNIID
jgi:hypothetical protein